MSYNHKEDFQDPFLKMMDSVTILMPSIPDDPDDPDAPDNPTPISGGDSQAQEEEIRRRGGFQIVEGEDGDSPLPDDGDGPGGEESIPPAPQHADEPRKVEV